MRINLTTQTSILTISNGDLEENGYLYKYFSEELGKIPADELEKNPDKYIIKTIAYNEEIHELVLLIFEKDEFTQKKILLEPV